MTSRCGGVGLAPLESEGLVSGSKTDFVVQGALPYKLHFVVLIERIVEQRLVDTVVSGDLDGPASLEISPSADGCMARPALDPRTTRAPVAPTLTHQPSVVVLVA